MKNAYNFLIVAAIMVFVIGCSCGSLGNLVSTDTPAEKKTNTPAEKKTDTPAEKKTDTNTGQNSNKTLTDKVTDVVTTGEKIGIQECDELMDLFRARIENENTDFVTKGILKALEATFREQIKQSLEQNNTDRDATAKLCQELKKQFDQQAPNPAK